jgi:hypothetical protein
VVNCDPVIKLVNIYFYIFIYKFIYIYIYIVYGGVF